MITAVCVAAVFIKFVIFIDRLKSQSLADVNRQGFYSNIRCHQRLRLAAGYRASSSSIGGIFDRIHPGSGGKNKCWSPNHFANTADTLIRQTGCQVCLSSGPADGPLAEEVSHLMTENATLLPQLPLRQFASFMATCNAYLGNDSGPTHLSAALGLPTVALFGPTNPHIWSPRGPKVHIVASPDTHINNISPTYVIKTLTPFLSQS